MVRLAHHPEPSRRANSNDQNSNDPNKLESKTRNLLKKILRNRTLVVQRDNQNIGPENSVGSLWHRLSPERSPFLYTRSRASGGGSRCGLVRLYLCHMALKRLL
jgi:hypothetical protein